MPDADEILRMAVDAVGWDQICVLTSPSKYPHCVPGKRAWISKHYPKLTRQILFGSCKHFIAGPNKLLIDDKDSNVKEFHGAGGASILVPRPWNSHSKYCDGVMLVVEAGMQSFLGAQNVRSQA